MNTSIGMIEKLRKYGFVFPRFDNETQKGMVFWYDNQEWLEGGRFLSDKPSLPSKVLDNGVWLPSDEHLFMWLEYNSFDYSVFYKDKLFSFIAFDIVLAITYKVENQTTLISALVKIIKKICQSKKRDYIPVEPEGYRIIDEYPEQ